MPRHKSAQTFPSAVGGSLTANKWRTVVSLVAVLSMLASSWWWLALPEASAQESNLRTRMRVSFPNASRPNVAVGTTRPLLPQQPTTGPDGNPLPPPSGSSGANFNFEIICDACDDQATFTTEWDFGDGTTAITGGPDAPEQAFRVSHGYTTHGVYTVRAVTTDTSGTSYGETYRTVYVSPHWADTTVVQTYPQMVAGDGAWVLWRMDDQGTSMVPAVGDPSAPGLYEGDVQLGEQGAIASDQGDTSALFLGEGKASVATLPMVDGTDAFTVEFWLSPAAEAVTDILALGDPDEDGALLVRLDGNALQVMRTGDEPRSYGELSIGQGSWNHVAIAYTGATEANPGGLLVYINGQQAGSQQTLGGEFAFPAGTLSLTIGKPRDQEPGYVGWIDEIALYDLRLTGTRAANHYTKGKATSIENPRDDRDAIWATSAMGLFDACGVAGGETGGGLAIGRQMFCPEPTTPPGLPEDLVLPRDSGDVTRNGVTGEDCFDRPGACGLPVDEEGEVLGWEDLVDLALATDLGDGNYALRYNPLNCADGWAVGKGGQIEAGVEQGCVSRLDWYDALGEAVDRLAQRSGTGSPQHHALPFSAATCADFQSGGITAQEARPLLRALALGIAENPQRGGSVYCDYHAPVTKREAYLSVARVLGVPSDFQGACSSLYRDLYDPLLDEDTVDVNDEDCPTIVEILNNRGVALIGDIECRWGAAEYEGVCANLDDALTRADAAVLLASLTINDPTLGGGFSIELEHDSPQPVGAAITVTATVYAPSNFFGTVDFEFGTPQGEGAVGSNKACDPSLDDIQLEHNQTLGLRMATRSCKYYLASEAPATVTVTAREAGVGGTGFEVSDTVIITAVNSAPSQVQPGLMPTFTEGADSLVEQVFSSVDPEGQTLVFHIGRWVGNQLSFVGAKGPSGNYKDLIAAAGEAVLAYWDMDTENGNLVGSLPGPAIQASPNGLASSLTPDEQILVFEAGDTFDPADYPGLKSVRVKVQGAGGGGGGAGASASGKVAFGVGGAGGGYAESFLTVDEIPGPVEITVGKGGAGGVGANPGSAGGDSKFGNLVIGKGGSGGNVAVDRAVPTTFANPITPPAGGGGTGDMVIPGGRPVVPLAFKDAIRGGFRSRGGDAFLGKAGAMTRVGGNGTGAGQNGPAGTGYGSGGGGATTSRTQDSANGGKGANGVVILELIYDDEQTLYFTDNATFNPNAYPGLKAVRVRAQGAGGGGGGAAGASQGSVAVAYGGNGGAYAESFLKIDQLGTSPIPITVGDGGNGGSAAGGAGSKGGDTSFGSLVKAEGGGGGYGAPTPRTPPTSGAQQLAPDLPGGTGQLVIRGSGSDVPFAVQPNAYRGFSSAGGNAILGMGGAGRRTSTAVEAAQAGQNYGGGGAGGMTISQQAGAAGGKGGDGILILDLIFDDEEVIYYKSAGTHTFTPGDYDDLAAVKVTAVGGGGGGGGVAAAPSDQVSIAYGGSGGGTAEGIVHVSQMGPSVQVVVGAGGSGGAAGANNGGAGGESRFGNFVRATGGAGGVGEGPTAVGTQGTTSSEVQGPAPGAGSGSANPLVISGGRSTVGFAVGAEIRQGVSSRGGNSKYGFGGRPRSMQRDQTGVNGSAYGSGGGGAYARGGQNAVAGGNDAAAGGNGAVGLVIVETVGIHRGVIEYGLDGALLNENRQPQGKSIGFSGDNNFQATVPGISNEDGAITTVEFWMRWDGTGADVGTGPEDAVVALQLGDVAIGFMDGMIGLWDVNTGTMRGTPHEGLSDQWAHVTAEIHNGVLSQSRLWVNGVRQNLVPVLGSVNPEVSASGDVLIGGPVETGFRGRLDEIVIYNGQLTTDDMRARYETARRAVVGVDEDGNNLVAITHADSTQANETTVTVRPLTGDVNGDYSFVIRACEYPAMENCSEPRTVTGTIEPFNDRPVGTSGGVVAEAVEGAEDGPGATPVVFTIHGADPSDAGWSGYQGGTASYRLTSAPEVGELYYSNVEAPDVNWVLFDGEEPVEFTNPQLRYIPGDAPYSDSQSTGGIYFTYQVLDEGHPEPGEWSATRTAEIWVENTNAAPRCALDSILVPDTAPSAVIANCTDPDPGDELTFTVVDSPTFGTLQPTGVPGTWLYTPQQGSCNYDTAFTYRATDSGGLQSDETTLQISVYCTTAAPTTPTGSIPTVDEDGPVARFTVSTTDASNQPDEQWTFQVRWRIGSSVGAWTSSGFNVAYRPLDNNVGETNVSIDQGSLDDKQAEIIVDPGDNWCGTYQIDVRVTDGALWSPVNTLIGTVNCTNDNPSQPVFLYKIGCEWPSAANTNCQFNPSWNDVDWVIGAPNQRWYLEVKIGSGPWSTSGGTLTTAKATWTITIDQGPTSDLRATVIVKSNKSCPSMDQGEESIHGTVQFRVRDSLGGTSPTVTSQVGCIW